MEAIVTKPLAPRFMRPDCLLQGVGIPVPRQQFVQLFDFVVVDAVENVREIGLWVEPV